MATSDEAIELLARIERGDLRNYDDDGILTQDVAPAMRALRQRAEAAEALAAAMPKCRECDARGVVTVATWSYRGRHPDLCEKHGSALGSYCRVGWADAFGAWESKK